MSLGIKNEIELDPGIKNKLRYLNWLKGTQSRIPYTTPLTVYYNFKKSCTEKKPGY